MAVAARGRRVSTQRLEVKPLLQAGAAEGVQAVEEGERLVEHIGADLWQRPGISTLFGVEFRRQSLARAELLPLCSP